MFKNICSQIFWRVISKVFDEPKKTLLLKYHSFTCCQICSLKESPGNDEFAQLATADCRPKKRRGGKKSKASLRRPVSKLVSW